MAATCRNNAHLASLGTEARSRNLGVRHIARARAAAIRAEWTIEVICIANASRVLGATGICAVSWRRESAMGGAFKHVAATPRNNAHLALTGTQAHSRS